MRYLIFTLLLLLICSLIYCGVEKNENTANDAGIFATFEVRYLEPEKELRGMATFKEGIAPENAQSIQFPEVYFQNKAMKLQNLGERGFRYFHSQKGPNSNKFDFRFKNQKGGHQSYEFSMPPVGDFNIREGKVQKSKGATIDWNGTALNSHQSIIFMFTDSLQKAASTFVKGPTQDSEFFIPAKDLSGLTLGKGQLYLVKKQFSPFQKAPLKVQTLTEFYTKTINIEVIE